MPATTAFLRRDGVLVTLVFLAVAAAFAFGDLDRRIALSWAFDAAQGDFRARSAFWANGLMHSGGRDLIWTIGLCALGCALAGYLAPRRFPVLRREARTLVGAVFGLGLTVVVVGVLKHFSNIDCPWDLQEFGGTRPYVPFFAARPTGLPVAGCFPAAHAASGYALFAFYFAYRASRPRLARGALIGALCLGVLYGIAQEARGAHFLSHDLWSAYLAWMLTLASQHLWGFLTGPRDPAALPQRASASRAAPIQQAVSG